MTTRNPSNHTEEEATDHGRHARVFRAARSASPVRAADPHATKSVWSHARAVWAIVGTADRRMPGAAKSRGSARRGDRAARPALAIRGRASDAGADALYAIRRFQRSAGSVRPAYRAADRWMGGISTAWRLPGTGIVWISSGIVWISPGIVWISAGIVWISAGSVRHPSRPRRASVGPVLAAVRDWRGVARPASHLWRWSAGGLSPSRGTVSRRNLSLAAADRESAPRESAPRRGGA